MYDYNTKSGKRTMKHGYHIQPSLKEMQEMTSQLMNDSNYVELL